MISANIGSIKLLPKFSHLFDCVFYFIITLRISNLQWGQKLKFCFSLIYMVSN